MDKIEKIEDFAETMKNNVAKRLGDKYRIEVRSVVKNNRVAYTGLDVKRNGLNIAPMIYLNDYFNSYKEGNITFQEIEDHIVRIGGRKSPCVDMRWFLHYEEVRKNIVYRLVNTEKNRELLEDIPHIEFMDLSIVFRCLVEVSDLGMTSILIHNAHMKLWDITKEQLFQEAEQNTQMLEGYEIKDMKETLCGLMHGEDQEQSNYDDEYMKEYSDFVPMYILSNHHPFIRA